SIACISCSRSAVVATGVAIESQVSPSGADPRRSRCGCIPVLPSRAKVALHRVRPVKGWWGGGDFYVNPEPYPLRKVRRLLAIAVFSLAASGATLAGAGLVVAPHIDPPGTPAFHDHVLAAYRFPIFLMHLQQLYERGQ